MIQLKNVKKTYYNGVVENQVLKGVNLKINKGEYVLIMGKSGSGKSTLLNILTGIDSPTSGEVRFGENTIQDLGEDELSLWRGENIGIVFQFFQLIPTLSVIENILLAMDLVNKIPVKDRHNKAESLLKMVNMYGHESQMPSTLSGGEQQRVAIARALANDVDIIVADEPTGNLDSKNAEAIFDLLASLKECGKTIVMVTHEREVLKGATRKILIKDGEIKEDCQLENNNYEAIFQGGEEI